MVIINKAFKYGLRAKPYVAQRSENRFAKIGKISLTLIVALFLLGQIFSSQNNRYEALDLKVWCNGVHIGYIRMATTGSSISGHFISIVGDPWSLDEAAELCNEHHFNWYQIIKETDIGLSSLSDGDGNKLHVPFVDPPPGGYRENNKPTLWADQLPWIYNEGYPSLNGTPGFKDMMLKDMMLKDMRKDISPPKGDKTIDSLRFEDRPRNHPPEKRIKFHTWLVSLNEDGSLHSWRTGFSWTWTSDQNGNATINNLEELDHGPDEEEYNHITGKFFRRKPVSTEVDDEGHVTWGGDSSDKYPNCIATPESSGGSLIFYWTTGRFDDITKTGAKHPGYAPFSMESNTYTPRWFHCPNDETITDWRYELIYPNGFSVVRGGNIQRNSPWEFHPIRELRDVSWRIPNISPFEGRNSTLGIFTAVNLDVYLANNPLGFFDGEWVVGQTLNELRIAIINGKINGLKGIYFATTDFTFDADSETGWVPIGGSDAWLNSDDFQVEHGEIGILGENVTALFLTVGLSINRNGGFSDDFPTVPFFR